MLIVFLSLIVMCLYNVIAIEKAKRSQQSSKIFQYTENPAGFAGF